MLDFISAQWALPLTLHIKHPLNAKDMLSSVTRHNKMCLNVGRQTCHSASRVPACNLLPHDLEQGTANKRVGCGL